MGTTSDYRQYNIAISDYERAADGLEELRSLNASVGTKDASAAVLAEYMVNNANRNAEKAKEEMILYRRRLIDYAGSDSVAKLDEQIGKEREALAKLLGNQMPVALERRAPLTNAAQVKRLQTVRQAESLPLNDVVP